MAHEEILTLAEDVLADKSRGYVTDAKALATFVKSSIPALRDCEQVVNNLTAVQTRCTDLLLQMRALKEIVCRLEKAAEPDPGFDIGPILDELFTATKAIQ